MSSRVGAAIRADVGQLAGRQALNLVVLIPGLSLLTLGTAFADTQNLADYDETWIIIAIQGFVVALVTFATLGFVVRFLPRRLRIVGVFTVYAATEVVRTIVVEQQALNRGLIDGLDWVSMLITAILTGGTIYGVASLAINQSYDFRTTVADLQSRTTLLQTTLARSELDANIARREIVRAAKDVIRAALKKAFGASGPASSGGTVPDTIQALLDVSDDVVRPLSRELLYKPGTFSGIQPIPVRTRLHFWEVINLASTTQPFRPVATIIVGGMLAIGAAVTTAPYGLGLVGLVVMLTFTYLMIEAANRFLTQPLQKLPFWARFILITLAYVVICLPDALAVGVVNGLPPLLFASFLGYAILMGSLILWYLATMTGVRRGFSEVIEKLKDVNRRLEWAVARVNARLWTDQKELSRILHNEVQGVLVATAFKMQRDLEAGNDVSLDIDAVRQTVFDALSSPSGTSTPPFESALADEQERWAGVLAITWNVDESTIAIIDEDRDARRVIVDLIHEFMVNAVKHGRAHNAQLWMQPTARGTMDISLYNDGLPMPKDRVPGLGIELAYSISVALRLPPHKKGVELRIEIPCEGTERYEGTRSEPVFASTVA